MPNGDGSARRDLHGHVFALHDALDLLEADETLAHMDYLLEGAEALLRSALDRFEQLRHCLDLYGRPTVPVIPHSKLEGPRA